MLSWAPIFDFRLKPPPGTCRPCLQHTILSKTTLNPTREKYLKPHFKKKWVSDGFGRNCLLQSFTHESQPDESEAASFHPKPFIELHTMRQVRILCTRSSEGGAFLLFFPILQRRNISYSMISLRGLKAGFFLCGRSCLLLGFWVFEAVFSGLWSSEL